MLFYLTSRLVSSVAAFFYPGYASYKTLSQRPASEEDLERWLMYWSVLGCIIGVEYVAEWAICWIPLYYPLKTLFLLYLALPQTQGSSYIYSLHLQPFFRTHEAQIDSLLAQLRVHIYSFLQKQVKLLWEHIGASVGQQPDASQAGAVPPPPPESAGGLGGVVGSLWRSYGPGILASGAAFIRQSAPAPTRPVSLNSPAGFGAAPSTAAAGSGSAASSFYRGGAEAAGSTQSVLDRRRQLEAELAALSAMPASMAMPVPQPYAHPSSLSSLSLPSAPLTPGASPSTTRSVSGGDITNRGTRERKDSVRDRFEEVEVPSDGEGYDMRGERPAATARTSWFGWGGAGAGKGYERVKDE
ncbi:protein YOP1 [Favolaschia claudopus]|uniref:Protein YOP1 n=1 Tax=Favolaschia claudopus TaxID=2862362 RepID=A0AAW0CQN4_9AGAR